MSDGTSIDNVEEVGQPQEKRSINYLEQKLIEKESKVKSAVLAAVLGFFFPFIGFIYVRRYIAAGVAVAIWVMSILLSTIGIGLVIMFLYAIICSYMCYKTADNLNTDSLKQAVETVN